MENFFSEKRDQPGRRPVIQNGAILLGLLSYFTQSQSLLQCSLRAGKYVLSLGMSVSTLSRYIKKFISLLIEIWTKIVYVPPADQLPDLEFLLNGRSTPFQNAKLAVDGTLIKKQINYEEGAIFFDRKGTCSINVMLVFDKFCNVRSVYANKPGSTNDKRVFAESWFGSNLGTIVPDGFFVLGDSGYQLTSKVIVPYRANDLSNDPNGVKLFFNKCQSSARMCAERGIGRLKQRMKPLMVGLNLSKAVDSCHFIVASVVLHQILLNIEDTFVEEAVDLEEFEVRRSTPQVERLGSEVRDSLAQMLYNSFTE